MWVVDALIRTAISTVRGRRKKTLGVFIVLGTVTGALVALAISDKVKDVLRREKDRPAPIDYGCGEGKGKGRECEGETPSLGKPVPQSQLGQTVAIPQGGGSRGFFSKPVTWPIIPLHMALLPNGRVMTYGTDQNGTQTGQIVYDIWNPTLGTGSSSHTVLPNKTNTDIFCSASSLLGSGFANGTQLLITGGDQTISKVRNFGQNFVETFYPATNKLTSSGTMNYARWYPSITTLPNGDKLLMGGIDQTQTPVLTPEIYHLATLSWTTLPGISVGGTVDNSANTWEWYYPRGFVGADGLVYLIQHNGQIFRLHTDGSGTMEDTGVQVYGGWAWYPSLMIAPYKVLTIRQSFGSPSGDFVQLVDLSHLDNSQVPPVVKPVVDFSLPQLGSYPDGTAIDRIWSNTTLLPDGRVLVTGGSAQENQLVSVYYEAQIYDPQAKTWTPGVSAQKPRLYHSATLLLPDGSVLTAGGGAPGPINELNAEIYYPSYLYLQDGSGKPAPRPKITSAPSTLSLGQRFTVTMGASDIVNTVGSMSLIRLGSNTHAFDPEQRQISISSPSQSGRTVTATLGSDRLQIPAGYYMLFVFNTAGIPAVATIVSVL